MNTKMPAAFMTPGPYADLEGFLGPEENAALLDYTLKNQENFIPSRIYKTNQKGRVDAESVISKTRISKIFRPNLEIRNMFQTAVLGELDNICMSLGVPKFEMRKVEIELAAHGDGAFFNQHIDSHVHEAPDGDTKMLRHISLVYYYCREPAKFSGGAFRMHAVAGNGQPETYLDIAPKNDRAIAFPSWLPHEVMPILLPGDRFEENRFAVNCWLYR